MKAVRFHAKRDIRVEDVPEPGRLAPDEVLIAPLLCGICGTDIHEYIAGPIVTPSKPHVYTGAVLPQILGHEFSARILETGSAVENVRPGDKVSVQPLISPRDDYYGRRGLFHLSEKMAAVGLSWQWGGMAEKAVVKSYNVYRMPDGMTDAQAAMVEPTSVAQYAVDRGRVMPGASVLVSGFGPIGALVLLAARAAGATFLAVSEPNPNRRAHARRIVPEALVLDPKTDNVVEALRDMTEDRVGVDVALECVGHEASLNTCAEAVRRQGRVVQVGLHIGGARVDPMLWALKDITLEATWCFRTAEWPRIASLIASGTLPAERIVTSTICAEDVVPAGFETLIDPAGTELKILVDSRA